MAKKFEPHEDSILKEHYEEFSAAAIGECLGRSRNSVIGRAFRLGLSKPKGWIDEREECRICGENLTIEEISHPMDEFGTCDHCAGLDNEQED